MIDKITELNLLYDFYAPLLTDKQREVIRLYHCENLSLSEIGEEFSISRQGVYDALKNAEKTLAAYEEKLGLMNKYLCQANLAESACGSIDALIADHGKNEGLKKELQKLRQAVSELAG